MHDLQSMYSEVFRVCARMYPAETKEMQYQTNKKSMYWYVLSTYRYLLVPFYESEVCTGPTTTGYILLSSLKSRYVLQNIHFLLPVPRRTGMYSVHTQYILEVKNMYSVHTWGKKYVSGTVTRTYRFMSVYSGTGPYYCMVHTGSYSAQYILV